LGHLRQYLLLRGQGDTASIHIRKQVMTKSPNILCEYQLIKTRKKARQLIACKLHKHNCIHAILTLIGKAAPSWPICTNVCQCSSIGDQNLSLRAPHIVLLFVFANTPNGI
jgi:hypothetical protein